MSDHDTARAAGEALARRVDALLLPDAPELRLSLLAGRARELARLEHEVRSPGRHALVSAEPGTGRSSLACLLRARLGGTHAFVRVGAEAGDDAVRLWTRATAAVPVLDAATPPLPGAHAAEPAEVAAWLARAAASTPLVLVLDDLDRLRDARVRESLAFTVAALSARVAGVTLVLLDGPDAADLPPASHPAAAGALVTVPLPRLSDGELAEALARILDAVNLEPEPGLPARIAVLAQGLPRPALRLGHAAARAAAAEASPRLTAAHLEAAIAAARAAAPDDVRRAYAQATVRARRGIFPEILLACALAAREGAGAFAADAVRARLERLVHRDVRGLTNQLEALAAPGRGAVLVRLAGPGPRYRFADPQLPHHVLLQGLEPGWCPPAPADERRAA
ncbi:MAG TPA: hypothetical protein VGU27_03905 [Candidatus Eisenbacteria bacterium]|nr:hypothetical protein [Candidatus Eisenbacteria bacterium]